MKDKAIALHLQEYKLRQVEHGLVYGMENLKQLPAVGEDVRIISNALIELDKQLVSVRNSMLPTLKDNNMAVTAVVDAVRALSAQLNVGKGMTDGQKAELVKDIMDSFPEFYVEDIRAVLRNISHGNPPLYDRLDKSIIFGELEKHRENIQQAIIDYNESQHMGTKENNPGTGIINLKDWKK